MAKQPNNTSNQKAVHRYSLLMALFIIAGLIVLGKTAYIMFVQHDYWIAVGAKFESRFKPLPATRGNILSADGLRCQNIASISIPCPGNPILLDEKKTK